MEVIKEILPDKVDYLNALKNSLEVPMAPPPVIKVVESVIHTPIIPEIPPSPTAEELIDLFRPMKKRYYFIFCW